jgi:hypothetical protein
MDDLEDTYYDLEAIKRFVDTISKNENEAAKSISYKLAAGQAIAPAERDKNTLNGVSLEDIRAAHRALAALLYGGADLKKELGLKQKTGPKKKRKFDMTIHSLEFGILCSLEGGAIKYHEALNYLQNEYWDAGETTAEEFIRDRRDAAKRFVTTFTANCPEGWKPYQSRDKIEKILEELKQSRENWA